MLLHTPQAAEWEHITGACDSSTACCATALETGDKPTFMPRHFISVTTFCRDSEREGCQECIYIHLLGEAEREHFCRVEWCLYLSKTSQPIDVVVEEVCGLR